MYRRITYGFYIIFQNKFFSRNIYIFYLFLLPNGTHFLDVPRICVRYKGTNDWKRVEIVKFMYGRSFDVSSVCAAYKTHMSDGKFRNVPERSGSCARAVPNIKSAAVATPGGREWAFILRNIVAADWGGKGKYANARKLWTVVRCRPATENEKIRHHPFSHGRIFDGARAS